ncbi:MAG: aminotransferase class V-fold PLP-dependent enzyme, partial [Rubrobacter sp.]|nr:aminotransferase class V-fold PLP-dependent enzyme [Rubrobacter sp.]
LCRRTGATLRWIGVSDDGRLDLSNLSTVVNERTKLVAFTHVSNVLGTLVDVDAIVAKAREVGATVMRVAGDGAGGVDLTELLEELGRRGIGSVMVEGGAKIITALLARRLVDRVLVCVAPKILGAGIEAVGDLGVRDLDFALELSGLSVRQCGVDLLLEAEIVYPEDREPEGCEPEDREPEPKDV